MIKHYNISITGRVQGVGFRYAAKRTAVSLGIAGFARNEGADGVYIEAEGEEENLKKFVDWCKKGPLWSKVEGTKLDEAEIQNYTEFNIDWYRT